MSDNKPSNDDWNDIFKKALEDQNFRSLLESDPTAALTSYASENGKSYDSLLLVSDANIKKFMGDAKTPACC